MNEKIVGFALAVLLATGTFAESQNTPRLGFLLPQSASSEPDRSRIRAFQQGLAEMGYVEGKNITIEYRSADGRLDRLPRLAAELVALKVDVIVTGGNEAIRAVKNKTSTIPVVMAFGGDPVGSGFVASLARPGGNITGLTSISQQLVGKRFELLAEIVPRLSKVAILWSRENPLRGSSLKEVEDAAKASGVDLQKFEMESPANLERAFTTMKQGGARAVVILPGAFGTTHRKQIVSSAAKNRLPAIYSDRRFVEIGGLMSYGAVRTNEFRRAAVYVDRILQGARPADIPVEQPTNFELIINLKTAKQIGLTIPPNVLARADKVIK
ncbi:MAG: ABC transporter substrate-binding protein [Deltaproteobacteria bacterium]|nr:ABC transporter substrate-binding protein [Deltaproteobacteria bacterium]